MAGSLTLTEPSDRSGLRPVRKYTLAWTSDAAGAVNGIKTPLISGWVFRVVFIPDATDAPSNLYDVTIEDANALDVLAGQGANLSGTVASNVTPGVPIKDGTTTSVAGMFIDDVLELKVTNAGDSKKGKVILYVG